MFRRSPHTGLPRRVATYYLFFSLAAIVWLGGSATVVSRAIVSSRAENTCLSRLGKASSTIVLDYVRNDKRNLQTLVERICREGSLAYCAIVSDDGRYLAHSSPEFRGKRCEEPVGARDRWGDVQRVRFVDSGSRVLHEYRTPLKQGDRVFGSLRQAVVEPRYWETLRLTAEHAPVAVLGPMLLLAVGAYVLQRLVRPMATIEEQLRRLALASSPSDVELGPVKLDSPSALGWNHLIELTTRQHSPTTLEARLSESMQAIGQRRAEEVLNSMPDGIAITDEEGHITFANRALSALFDGDATNGSLRGKTMKDYLAQHVEVGAESQLFASQLRARTVVEEINKSTETGQYVFRAARHPIRSSDQQASFGYVWSIRDVTQQKLAEKMRDQFLDAATHELRTPLANMKAYAETLALNEVLDIETQKEFCNTINSEATRLARFIDDLLSISSMEVGSLSLLTQNVDVERLLGEVIDKVRPLMVQKEIEFDSYLPEKMPKLNLDKDKIIATLVNLLGNAAKYTAVGGRVGLKVRVADDHLQIDVEDSGFGVSEEELPHVFDKFFRSSDPRVQEQPGTGLGLSLAHEVARLHGGALTVQSEIDKGTTFTLTLPIQ